MRLLFLVFSLALATSARAHTANKVWFEFQPGFYRVVVEYTIPDLKQYREAYSDFTKKKDAEAFYWALIRGADFFLGNPKQIAYPLAKKGPDPW